MPPRAAGAPQAPANAARARRADPAALRIDAHRKVIGVFHVVLGVLNLCWAGLWFLQIFVFLGGGIEQGPGEPPVEFGAAVAFGLFVLSMVLAAIQLVAGAALLQRKRGCRKLGIASAVASCAGLWACCFYPFCLGCGIYSLIVLLSHDAGRVLDA
jgi:hypothetical protein